MALSKEEEKRRKRLRDKRRPILYKPKNCHPGKGCFTCPYPDCKCMVNTTEEETEMKKAGNQPKIRHDKKVSDWLNHSLAKG